MTFADCIEVVYKGQKNTPEGIQKAFEAGMISKETRNQLLEKHCLNLQEVA